MKKTVYVNSVCPVVTLISLYLNIFNGNWLFFFVFVFFVLFLHQFNLIHLLYRYSFKVIIKRFISNINFYKVINQNENRVGLNTWLTQKSYNNPCYIVNILFWETTISSIVHTSCSIQAIVKKWIVCFKNVTFSNDLFSF